jgi:hypothetical protein
VITAALVLLQIVTALPTSKVLWDVETTDTPTRFEVRYNTGDWVPGCRLAYRSWRTAHSARMA